MENIQNYVNEKDLAKKVNVFVDSVNQLTKRLNGDIYNLQNAITQCVQGIPEIVAEGLNSSRKLSKMKNLAIARESLEQCKRYLSMLKIMKFVSTQDLINQVEEINKLMDNQIKRTE